MIEVESPLTAMQLEDQLSTIDRSVARRPTHGRLTNWLNLHPLPVLGIPG
jgi:hypothetical protein